MAKWDSAELLATMKRRGMVPTNQGTFSDADLLLDATFEMESVIISALIEAHGEYAVQVAADVPLVVGQDHYAIPTRSVGLGLRDMVLISNSGSIDPVYERDPKELARLNLTTLPAKPRFYYMEGNKIVLHPTPDSTYGSLRMKYHMRPGRLVPVTSARQVDSIGAPSGGNIILTLASNKPGSWSTATPFDLIGANPGFDVLAMDVTASAVGTATVTVPAAATTGFAVGDWVALAGEAPMPRIPPELHLPLALRAIAPALRALGNKKLADDLVNESDNLIKSVVAIICPRNKAAEKDIVSYEWFGVR